MTEDLILTLTLAFAVGFVYTAAFPRQPEDDGQDHFHAHMPFK